MNPTRRSVLGGAVAAAVTSTMVPTAAAGASPRLSNLAHLDFLRASVTPPVATGHSTFGSGPLGVLWTYADRQPDGSYQRIGGGTYAAATDTYGQGAYNADDIARAAVVYLRHWDLFHDTASLAAARGLLRGLNGATAPTSLSPPARPRPGLCRRRLSRAWSSLSSTSSTRRRRLAPPGPPGRVGSAPSTQGRRRSGDLRRPRRTAADHGCLLHFRRTQQTLTPKAPLPLSWTRCSSSR